MANIRWVHIFLFVLTSLLFEACHRVDKQNNTNGTPNTPKASEDGVAGRFGPARLIAGSGEASIKIYEEVMSDVDREATKKAYADLSMTDYPLEPIYRVSAKQFGSSQDLIDKVYLEPSLYVYNSAGEPLTLQQGADGKVRASFVGVFYDGLAKEVPGLAPQTSVSVPDSAGVNEVEKLKSVLANAGKSPFFMPGCIGHVELNIDGTSYPVMVESVDPDAKAGLCEIENRPLRFSAVMPPQDWRVLVKGAQKVGLNINYQITAPLVTKRRTIAFEKSFFNEKINANFAAGEISTLSASEFDLRLRRILGETKVEDLLTTAFGAQSDQAMKELMRKIEGRLRGGAQNSDESDSAVIEVPITESENIGIGKSVVVWRNLRVITIARTEISHLMESGSADTGFSVVRGSLLTFEMAPVEIEKRTRERSELNLMVKSADNTWFPMYTVEMCGSGEGCQNGYRSKDWGHWEYRMWSQQDVGPAAASYVTTPKAPQDLAADFFGGLHLLVSQGGRTCEFPLTGLELVYQDNKVSFASGKSSDCGIFESMAKDARYSLSLVNHISANPVTISKTVLIQGDLEPAPSSSRDEGPFTFTPHIRVNGSVLLQGLESYR